MTSREEYAEMVCYNISEEDILRLFGITKDEVENGKWNQNLEIAYSEYLQEEGEI